MNASPQVPGPEGVRTPEQLLERLAELRAWAGRPSLRTLRRLAGTTTSPSGDVVDALPASTTSYVLNGRGLPRPPRLEFVESFVTACLLACEHPRHEIPPIVERWRACWRSLALAGEDNGGANPGQATPSPGGEGLVAARTAPRAGPAGGPQAAEVQAVPAGGPRAAEVQAVPAGGPRAAETQAAVGVAPESRARPERGDRPAADARPRGGRRVPLWAALGLAGVAAAAGVVGTTLAYRSGDEVIGLPPVTSEADIAGPAGELREVRRGVVEGMRDVQGFDADRGVVLRKGTRGIDLSAWASGNNLATKSQAVVMPLRETGGEDHRRCSRRPARAKTQEIRGLHAWRPGQGICVWTAEGSLALLTLTRTPSPADPHLAFSYVVWRPR